MNPPRVLLVTRRFWPLTGGAETHVTSLAAELQRIEVAPTILTARWQSDWPPALTHRGVPVTRLINPGASTFGTLRYMLSLGRWLRGQAGAFDLVYVSKLRHDAYTALTLRSYGDWPVVLRAEGAGPQGDCAWQAKVPFGQRIARTCHAAEAIVAPSPLVRDELLAAGYPGEKLHVISSGVAIPSAPVDAAMRQAARADLAEAHNDFKLPEGARLAVYAGRLRESKGLTTLVAAWRKVVARHRDARLWLVGSGPLETELEDQIRSAGLTGRVVLTGAFDAVDQVLHAADLFVLPSRHEGLSLALLEAMAAGLPVVASDIPGNRLAIDSGRHGLLVPTGDADALAAGIDELLSQPEWAATLGAAGRARVSQDFPVGKMVRQHRELFEQLLSKRGG